MTPPIAAGYIVHTAEGIYGHGPTAYAAWAHFLTEMRAAHVRVLSDDADSSLENGAWTRAGHYKIAPATARLIAEVKSLGGYRTWETINGIACTEAEHRAFHA